MTDSDLQITYSDLHEMDEDTRIGVIGRTVMLRGMTVGVMVDDIPGKAERYIEKLKKRFAGIVTSEVMKGPTPHVLSFTAAPPAPTTNGAKT